MENNLLIVGGASAAIHLLAEFACRARAGQTIHTKKIMVIDKAVHPVGGSPHADPSAALRVNMRTELHNIKGQLPFREFLERFGGADEEPPLRADLGRYVAYVKQAVTQQLVEAGIAVTYVRDEVARLEHCGEEGWRAVCRSGRTVEAARVVLALGNPPPQLPANVKVNAGAEWRVSYYNGATGFARRIEPDEAVVVLGTGPSAIDVARHLIEQEGHKAPIYLSSRTGTLSAMQLASPAPRELVEELRDRLAYLRQGRIVSLDLLRHEMEPVFASYDPSFKLEMLAGTPPDALADLKMKLGQAAQDEPRWRLAVEAFGLLAPEIWRGLDEGAKLEFVFNEPMVRAYYTNRHAMQPATARWLVGAMETGQVRVGRVGAGGFAVDDDGVRGEVTLLPGGSIDLEARHLVVATGPQYKLSRSGNPLIRQLLDEGAANPYCIGAYEVGGFLTSGLELDGMPGVFAMGALVRGEDYAVHSFPALARHARTIAEALGAAKASR